MTTKDGLGIGAQVLEDYLEEDLKLRRQRLLMGVSTVDYEDGKQAGLELAIETLRRMQEGAEDGPYTVPGFSQIDEWDF